MRKIILLFLLVTIGYMFADVPSCYYTYDELKAEIDEWVEQYPDIIKVDSIGATFNDNRPIWAVKISDNVQVEEDEPALIFVGQVHAEELMGVQVTMKNINKIMQSHNNYPYNNWVSELELWFIPTLNPDGHSVVLSNEDTSFRKNKRDNDGNGFMVIPGPGDDIDGVDLNRNFSFNWVHGDTLYSTNGEEEYDYYRGPGPISEGETQALERLADEQHFVYGIVWHTSRTGNFSEKVFYPMQFFDIENRSCPDFDLSESIGIAVAEEIDGLSGNTYAPYPSRQNKGTSTPWFYQKYGTIQLTIEASSIQPDSLQMTQIVRNCEKGVKWLLNRSLNGYGSLLTGHVTDAQTGLPIVAEVIVEEKNASYFAPRLTDDEFGRFWRPISSGTYTVKVQKEGYHTEIVEDVVVSGFSWRSIEVSLEPKQTSHFSGVVYKNNELVNGNIRLLNDVTQTNISVEDGYFSTDLFEGTYDIEVTAEGAYPYLAELIVEPGTHYVVINLDNEDLLFHENWDDTQNDWSMEGPWVEITEIAHEGSALTDSWGGYGFYEPNCNVYIQTETPIDLNGTVNPLISLWQHVYTEWDFDFVYIQVSTDSGVTWNQIYELSGRYDYMNQIFVSLNDYIGESILIRFNLVADSPDARLVDPGWTLDDIKVIDGDAEYLSSQDLTIIPNIPVLLKQNYPNPFNPETNISFSFYAKHPRNPRIDFFNIKGQVVDQIKLSQVDVERGKIVWSADNLPTGLYFYRIITDSEKSKVNKALLIK